MLRRDLAAAREFQPRRGVPHDEVDQSVADGGGGGVEGGLESFQIDVGAASSDASVGQSPVANQARRSSIHETCATSATRTGTGSGTTSIAGTVIGSGARMASTAGSGAAATSATGSSGVGTDWALFSSCARRGRARVPLSMKGQRGNARRSLNSAIRRVPFPKRYP
jgi:hypothetical protein